MVELLTGGQKHFSRYLCPRATHSTLSTSLPWHGEGHNPPPLSLSFLNTFKGGALALGPQGKTRSVSV